MIIARETDLGIWEMHKLQIRPSLAKRHFSTDSTATFVPVLYSRTSSYFLSQSNVNLVEDLHSTSLNIEVSSTILFQHYKTIILNMMMIMIAMATIAISFQLIFKQIKLSSWQQTSLGPPRLLKFGNFLSSIFHWTPNFKVASYWNIKDRIKTEKASAENNEGNVFDNVF